MIVVTLDIPFIDHLFRSLWLTAAHHQTAIPHRLRALGTLSESAVFYYRECDTIVDLVYKECLELMKDPVYSSEAAVILWLMFHNYKGKLGSKKALEKVVIALCLETFEVVLETESKLVDWLSILEFLIFYKLEKVKTLYEKFSQRLLHVVTGNHEPMYRISAFNILMDFKGCNIKSAIVFNRCLDTLYGLADDTASPVNQMRAIRAIIEHYPEAMEQCFYRLFDFTEGSDIAAFEAWEILFTIESSGFPNLEAMGHQFVQRALKLMADKDLKLSLKAINFMMTSFKQNAYGFSSSEIHTKAYLNLLTLVKTEQFWSSDYLEGLRLYFKIMRANNKKIRSIQQGFVNASNG